MKQSILSKCFAKMKRVALALFAALCVGSVWAEDGEVTYETTPMADPSAGYICTGLGTLGNEVAVVFTNHTKAVTWTVPANLYNVEFLVVGGGGGGGADNVTYDEHYQAGGGGGGGGVVTGLVNFVEGEKVSIKVGAGGIGGVRLDTTKPYGDVRSQAENSYFSVGTTTVTANAGGGDPGSTEPNATSAGAQVGGVGGSSSGSRSGATGRGEATRGIVEDTAGKIVSYTAFGNKGGAGHTSYQAGGGGGATTEGEDGTESVGGDGGEGIVLDITGTSVVYGSGGGGGALTKDAGFGGSGAGNGGRAENATSAAPNQGGGGGGGGRVGNGGNGGSGIVVLRYRKVIQSSDVEDSITPVRWTGENLSANIVDTESYTVSCESKKDIGQNYELTVTPNSGWAWEDNTTEPKVFYWEIIKAENEWVKAPVLSATSWIVGETDKIALTPLSELQLKYNCDISVIISENGGESENFDGNLPTEVGRYTLTYTASGGDTYNEFVYSINFAVNDNPTVEALPNAVGYKLLGLGVNNDEVAVVFTKSSDTWKPPVKIDGAQFLVVGGGGGGGADTHDEAACGGAGGGGGGVVTGEVDLAKGANVVVAVGAGGTGGQLVTDQKDGESGNFYGASIKGGNSVLTVDKKTYVTAYGGGRDRGADTRYSYNMTVSNMREGGQGGSNGGSRGGITADQSKNPTKGAVASNAALRNCTTYGNKGGKGCSDYFYGYPSAGGGGGAIEAGGDAGNEADDWAGGKGGEGLASWITGNRVVYGSGGGGASTQGSSGGPGGEGAGNGGDRSNSQGTAGSANQGGGGGGSSRSSTYGGNGGSGIVVIRYKTTIHTVKLPDIENATWYNGANQVTEFKVEEGTTIPLTLKAADGYFFENGTGEMVFNIGQNGTDGQTPQYLPAVAKIGEVKYSLLSAALANAVAGAEIELVANIEVVEVIEVPNGVTLNLNGKTFKGDALGAVAVNKGTYVTPQNYKMVGPDADYYKSENAVLTICEKSITLNSGSLEVVPDEWWTLPDQTLTIAEDAEFIIPEGKKMNNNGSTVVINGTLSGEGAINLYSLDATVQGAEGLKVTTTVDGYKVQYADGVYTLVKSELDVTIGDDTFDTVEELIAAANTTKTMTVTGNDWSAEGNVLKKGDDAYVTFADYYTVVVNGSTVTLTLNDTVKPVIGDSTEGADDAFTVSAEEVTIKITNYNSALKYGVRSAADIKGLDSATIQPVNVDNGEMTVQKSGDSQFYKVVVLDVDFSQAK